MAADRDTLLALLPRLKGRRVVVLGDPVLDEFVYGEMKRVYGDVARTSREVAFGLLLRQQGVERRPGGAANAVSNLLALGARPVPFGFLGDDETGRWLRSHLRSQRVDTRGLRAVPGWTTPVKMRIVAGSMQSASQQVLRLDREAPKPPPAGAQRQLVAAARAALRGADAVLVADYGYGAATPDRVKGLLGRKGGRPVVVDSRNRAREFRGASALTPSVPELEEAYHEQFGVDVAKLTRAARRLLRETAAHSVLLTRGRHGMLLVERGRKPVTIPIFGGDQVADVTGAGDTVAAVFTAALASGASTVEAAQLANVAGGLAVTKRGTATVSAAELARALGQDSISGGNPAKARR